MADATERPLTAKEAFALEDSPFNACYLQLYRVHIEEGATSLGIDPKDRFLGEAIHRITHDFALGIALRALGYDRSAPSPKAIRDVLIQFSRGRVEALEEVGAAQYHARIMLSLEPPGGLLPTYDPVEIVRRGEALQQEAARIAASMGAAPKGQPPDKIFDNFLSMVEAISNNAGFPRSLGGNSFYEYSPDKPASPRTGLAYLMLHASTAYATAFIERKQPKHRLTISRAFDRFRRMSFQNVHDALKAARKRQENERNTTGEGIAK